MADNQPDSTRSTLIDRLRDRNDLDAWRQFNSIYPGFVYQCARRFGLPHDDAEDVRSECTERIIEAMPSFQYDRSRGRFRGWLKTITRRLVKDWQKRKRPTINLEIDAIEQRTPRDPLDAIWLQECLSHVLSQLGRECSSRDFQVLQMFQGGADASAVAGSFGISSDAARQIKSRLYLRLRELLFELDADLAPT